jgi:hypothetical protein
MAIELNEETLALVVAELQLQNPPHFLLNHSGNFSREEVGDLPKGAVVRGTYQASSNTVTITSQGEWAEREGLYVITKHIRFTILHELRHAWQRENWSDEEMRLAGLGKYEYRKEELDANSFADYASPKYRTLVQIKRQQIGNRRRLPG